jgi:acetolactate synthase-1/2/3 large subunit
VSEAQREVVKLAEILSIPVATSLNAKGTIPEDHPLCIGVVGSYSRWCTNRLVAEADLVLFIGSHTGSQVTNEWRIPPAGTPVIQIDIDPGELGRNYPAEVALLGDVKVTVRRLLEAVEPKQQTTEWLQHVHRLVGEWRTETEPLLNSDAVPIRPERICQELTGFLPSDALLVSCTGHSGIWTGTMVELRKAGQSFIRAAGSLGWAFPAAMGAKCGQPQRPVICFTGDGGLWYHIEELETAVRHGINTVTVVNNNRSLNQVGPAYADTPGTDELWQFSDINFAEIARTMGAFGVQVRQPGELRTALEQALESDRPALIDVVSDIGGIAPRAWTG